MTKALMATFLCGLLIGCSNYERFGVSAPEERPTQIAAPAPAAYGPAPTARAAPPLMECRSSACRTECRLEHAPRWCAYFKKPT